MLNEGCSAPTFELPDDSMTSISLKQFRGRKNVVLHFYAKDNTPACTQQAVELSELQYQFDRLDAMVLVVSRDDCLVHAAFRDRYGISCELLSDPDAEVCNQYGVIERHADNGHVRETIVRSTFVIDREGVIRKVIRGGPPREHARAVVDALTSLTTPRAKSKANVREAARP